MAMTLGVPLKLLQEFSGKNVTVEASCGEIYKGELLDAEENMSLNLKDVNATLANGKQVDMKSVYIKGSRIRVIKLPEDAANNSLRTLTRPVFRGGFRGGRGGRRGGGRPSYDRPRY